MNETPAGSLMRDVGDRLRSASEIEPARMPRFLALAEAVADESTVALAGLCVRDVEVRFKGCDIGKAPEAEAEDYADHLVLPLHCKRFVRPAFAAVPFTAVDVFIQAFFGAGPSRDGGAARPLTDLDRALSKMAVETVVAKLQQAFRPIDPVAFTLGAQLSPELYAETFESDGARFVLVRFEIAVGAATGPIVLALPTAYLTLHRRYFSAPVDLPEPSPDEEWTQAIGRNFERSDLKLDLVLSRKKVPLSTVARFRVGQTVALDVGVLDLIAAECEGKPLFRSQVGFAKGSYVVRFEERIDPAQEFIDDILAD